MAPILETRARQSPLEVFGFAFKWWLSIFITILIPLDFLYRSSSILEGLDLLQLAINLSSIVLFFASIAIIIASVSLIFDYLFGKIFSADAEYIEKANFFGGLIFIIINILFYGAQWAKIVFHIPIYLINYKLRPLILCLVFITLVIITIIFYKKFNLLYNEIKPKAQKLFKFNAVIIILGSVILLAVTLIPFYANGRTASNAIIFNKERLPGSYPNIILVTFDALSVQHSSIYGYEQKTTPNLEKLGKASYVFANMYSSSNWTLPSLCSLMTGKNPNTHRVNEALSYLSKYNSFQTLPILLKKLGYETGAVWSNWTGCPWRMNLRGIDRIIPADSINIFISDLGLGTLPWLDEIIHDSPFFRAKDYVINWLYYKEATSIVNPEYSFTKAKELLMELSQPFFLWIHIYPPHDPYLANGKFLYSILKEKIFDNKSVYLTPPFPNPYPPRDQIYIDKLALRYDENICYADHEFGKFLSFLHEKSLFEDSIVIFSSDHGEMFEKGWWRHGGPYLYQPLIHVPFIIHLPGQFRAERISADVSLADIAPTILDFLEVKTPEWMDGRSFKQAFYKSGLDTGTKFSMKLGYYTCPANFKSRSVAAIKGNYKLIKYLDWDRFELYDLRNDPQEQLNLISNKPEIFSALRAEIEQALGK